ncbi:MAG TPA: hypothetical protein V6C57_20620 [Coleofasciculaceae cyanobacterium]
MEKIKAVLEKLPSLSWLNSARHRVQDQFQVAVQDPAKVFTLKNLRGGLLVGVGYLLSPLCWWNDLIFNLPIAYAFGSICNRLSPGWLLPGAIAGYWLSNLVGILMMQFGLVNIFQGQPQDRNLKQELLTGVVTSTVYTLIILALVQLKILDAPNLFANESAISLSSLLAIPMH